MLNSKPNNSKYNGGNYIPINRDKVIKLNDSGGVYYRSSWEKKIMTWLDLKSDIVRWGSECFAIPYQLTHFNNGDVNLKSHTYYPDFYYEMQIPDGSIKRTVVEVKPMKEYKMVQDLNEGRLVIPTNLRRMKNFEYDLKMAQKNSEKWKTVIKWCNKKGFDFIIITEEHLKKFNV
jgi:hypothetical protein